MSTTSIRRGAATLGLLLLAGCGSSATYGGGSAADTGSSSAGGGASDAVLATSDSELGRIVVDADGRTVYVFDKDTPGSGRSACSGDCLAKWPAVTADPGELEVDGVTGEVGTITRDDGTEQLTLAGMPLYLFAGDSQAGDVTGQGVGGVWWVVSPDGTKHTGGPASPSAAPPPAPPGY